MTQLKSRSIRDVDDIPEQPDWQALTAYWENTPLVFANARLQRLLDYWKSRIPSGRMMPSRTDIDPRDLKEHLDDIMMIELTEPENITAETCFLRVVGTNLTYFHGRELTGTYLSEFALPNRREKGLMSFRHIAEYKAPLRYVGQYIVLDGEAAYNESLAVPLSNDGNRVNMILSSILLSREPVSRNPDKPVMRESA